MREQGTAIAEPLNTAVDETDRALVALLRADGRASNRSLATALGVNETTIAARLRRLEERGVMRVVAVTDMQSFGFEALAFAEVRVSSRSGIAVAEALGAIPEAIGIVATSGGSDVMMTILARDAAHVAEVVGDAVSGVDGVESVRCELAVDIPRFHSSWVGLGLATDPLPQPPAIEGWDDLDLAIIHALQGDARSSNRSIAADLDVSEATIRARVRRMEGDGAIRIQAVSDVQAFGLLASGYVAVEAQPGAVAAAGDALLAIQEMGVVARTLGTVDYIALAVAATRDRLLSVVLEQLAHDPSVKAVRLMETHAMIKHTYTWAQL